MDWTLQRRPDAQPPAGPVIVVIMDGVGVGRGDEGDAVALARTPTLDGLRTRFPWRTLRAHGTAVGLPDDGDMGNSEVGHNALGAGRIFDQGAKLVNQAIADGRLFRGDAYFQAYAELLQRAETMNAVDERRRCLFAELCGIVEDRPSEQKLRDCRSRCYKHNVRELQVDSTATKVSIDLYLLPETLAREILALLRQRTPE